MRDALRSELTSPDKFTEFVKVAEPRLRRALSACLGVDRGREAAAEALVLAWEHWDKVQDMSNPVGYLYVAGRNFARKAGRPRRESFVVRSDDTSPMVEPGLPSALARLSDRERTVVLLIHGYGWSMSEVADTLGIAKSTVQTHSERGMKSLRRKLGVWP